MQGLTEFLPISSSGHLVITRHLFGNVEVDLFFDTILHLGTLAAVIAVFYSDIFGMITHFFAAPKNAKDASGFVALSKTDPLFRLALLVVVGTVPAVILGLAFESTFEKLFGSLTAVGIALCITGSFLLATRFAPKAKKGALETTFKDTLLIGLAQAVAIIPGISRSGATISAALFLKIDRELAGKFSFLLAIPAILGAVVLQFKLPSSWPGGYVACLAGGFASSAFVGYFALKMLIGLVKKGKFHYFGFYCIPIGILAVALSLM